MNTPANFTTQQEITNNLRLEIAALSALLALDLDQEEKKAVAFIGARVSASIDELRSIGCAGFDDIISSVPAWAAGAGTIC